MSLDVASRPPFPMARSVLSKRLNRESPLPKRESSTNRTPGADLDELMVKVAQGDADSFADLYDRLSSLVYGLVRRIVRSEEHTEEVTQEVFLEVWRKASAWQSNRGSAVTWVLMIARARATDRVRSEQAIRDRQTKVAPGWVDPGAGSIEEPVLLEEEHRDVRSALEALSAKQREVIELAYYRGQTYVEVAETLGIPLGTVKTRMRDGLMTMRRAFGGER